MMIRNGIQNARRVLRSLPKTKIEFDNQKTRSHKHVMGVVVVKYCFKCRWSFRWCGLIIAYVVNPSHTGVQSSFFPSIFIAKQNTVSITLSWNISINFFQYSVLLLHMITD